MVIKNFEELINKVKISPNKKRMVVAVAGDIHTLEAVYKAYKEDIIYPILVGKKEDILKLMTEISTDFKYVDIYDIVDEKEACEFAVSLIRENKADFLMKGKVDTKVILKAVVNKENGLNKGEIMSHFVIVEVAGYHKMLIPVDGGMVTYPTLEQKKAIIENTVDTLLNMGYTCPKVGVLACTEKVNPNMPETLDGDALKQMNIAGEIKNCIVEGPISYDCAIDKSIADAKGFKSEVAGDVDIIIAPNIHAGNIIGKILTCTCGAKMAGFIVGAKCPVVLTSRASSAEEKYLSIVVSAAATM